MSANSQAQLWHRRPSHYPPIHEAAIIVADSAEAVRADGMRLSGMAPDPPAPAGSGAPFDRIIPRLPALHRQPTTPSRITGCNAESRVVSLHNDQTGS